MSAFAVGNMLGWTSPMQPLLTSDHPPVGAEPITTETISWIGSVNYLSSLLSTFFWGRMSDRYGRKRTACLVVLPFALGWTITLFAQNAAYLIVARLIIGTACSGAIINTPIYIAEMASDKIRGTLGSYFMVFFNAGCLFSYTVGALTSYHTTSAVCLSVPIVFLLLFVWLPESPVSLWTHDKKIEAENSLLWFRGGDTVQTVRELIRLKSKPTQQSRVGFKALFSTKGSTKAMLISFLLICSQHLCGLLVILTYAVHIFQQAGSSITPHASAVFLGCLQLFGAWFSSLVVDRVGRKPPLVISMISMGLCLSVLGIYLYFKDDTWDVSIYGWIPVLALSLHVGSFGLGAASVVFIVMTEIFPPEINGLAISQIQLVSTLLSFVLVKLYPFMKIHLQMYGCLWFFSAWCFVLVFLIILFVPETKGRTLQSILRQLNNEDTPPDSERDSENELTQVRNKIVIVNKTKKEDKEINCEEAIT